MRHHVVPAPGTTDPALDRGDRSQARTGLKHARRSTLAGVCHRHPAAGAAGRAGRHGARLRQGDRRVRRHDYLRLQHSRRDPDHFIGDLLDRRPGKPSGGERQRVALGRALLSKPRLLLLDEPLGSLDESRKEEILPYLVRLRDEGIPMVYVSHDAAELRQLATQIVMLKRGRVTALGGVKVLT